MKEIITFILILSLFTFSRTSTLIREKYKSEDRFFSRINKLGKHECSYVILITNEEFYVEKINVHIDSTYWIDMKTKVSRAI
jgi:hypothetical protein